MTSAVRIRPKAKAAIFRRLSASVKVVKATDPDTGKEVPALNPDEPLTIEGIANANIADRVNERLDPRGCVLDSYLENPIILSEHDYCKPIGTAVGVELKDDGVHFAAEIGQPKLAPLTQLQIDTRSLVAQGIIKAISVGFIPLEIQPAEYDDTGKVTSPLIYKKWELLEISLVSVPCNAGSLFSMKELKAMTPIEFARLMKDGSMGGESGEPAQGPAAEMLQKIYDAVNATLSKVAELEGKVDELLKDEADEEEGEDGEDEKPGEEKGKDPKKPDPKKPVADDEGENDKEDEEETKPKKPAKPDPAKDEYKKTMKRIDGVESKLGELAKAMRAIADAVVAKK